MTGFLEAGAMIDLTEINMQKYNKTVIKSMKMLLCILKNHYKFQNKYGDGTICIYILLKL